MLEIKKIEEQNKEVNPSIIIGQIPCEFQAARNVAWDIIRPYVEDFAEKSEGEYKAYHVIESIKASRAFLFMGYINRGAPIPVDRFQESFAGFLEKGEKDFFGYVLLRFDLDSVHIWQAYIKEEYQNTDILDNSFKYIEKEMKRYSVPYLTFSSPRLGWSQMCKRLGFKEIYTIYRKKLERD